MELVGLDEHEVGDGCVDVPDGGVHGRAEVHAVEAVRFLPVRLEPGGGDFGGAVAVSSRTSVVAGDIEGEAHGLLPGVESVLAADGGRERLRVLPAVGRVEDDAGEGAKEGAEDAVGAEVEFEEDVLARSDRVEGTGGDDGGPSLPDSFWNQPSPADASIDPRSERWMRMLEGEPTREFGCWFFRPLGLYLRVF